MDTRIETEMILGCSRYTCKWGERAGAEVGWTSTRLGLRNLRQWRTETVGKALIVQDCNKCSCRMFLS
jgi:hypothetical protein